MQKQIKIDLAWAGALLTIFFLTWAMPAGAQNRIVVPLSHSSQPATLRVTTMNGSIVVRAYSGNQVIIESSGGSHHRAERVPPEAEGMHRLNGSAGLSASEDNNVVTVHTSIFGGGGNLDIQVPVHTSMQLHSMNGDRIEVDGVTGDISAEDTNGNVVLNNVSGSIVASAMNGRITAIIGHLDANKPSSFSSMNGTIDITLPADVHADLRLKTSMGQIYMDNGFAFQQSQAPGPVSERSNNGMYRVHVDNTIFGKLNGGGPQIQVQNFNGNIYIHKGH